MSIFTEDLQIQDKDSDWYEPGTLNFRGSPGTKIYELTITYKPSLWTIAKAYHDETFLNLLLGFVSPYSVSNVYVVKEYQKTTFFPHLHLAIEMSGPNQEIPKKIRETFTRLCFKKYGRMTFCDLRKDNATYESYLNKDLYNNFKKSGVCHYRVFTKN